MVKEGERLFFQVGWTDTETFPKGTVEHRIIVKATLRGSLPGWDSLSDQSSGIKKTFLTDIGMNGGTGLLFEQTHEMISAQKNLGCEDIDG